MFALLSIYYAERCKICIADHFSSQAMGQQTGIPLDALRSIGIGLFLDGRRKRPNRTLIFLSLNEQKIKMILLSRFQNISYCMQDW